MIIGPNATIEEYLLWVLAVLIILIFAGSIYGFFMAIFQFIFSKGEEGNIKKAWNTIRYTILGLLFSLVVLFVIPLIFNKFTPRGAQRISVERIFAKVGDIATFIFKGKVSNSSSRNYTPPAESL